MVESSAALEGRVETISREQTHNYARSFLNYALYPYRLMAKITEDVRRLNEKTMAAYQRSYPNNQKGLGEAKAILTAALDLVRKKIGVYVGDYQTEVEVRLVLKEEGYPILGKSNFVCDRGAILATLDFKNGTIKPLNGHDVSGIVSILSDFNFTVVEEHSKS